MSAEIRLILSPPPDAPRATTRRYNAVVDELRSIVMQVTTGTRYLDGGRDETNFQPPDQTGLADSYVLSGPVQLVTVLHFLQSPQAVFVRLSQAPIGASFGLATLVYSDRVAVMKLERQESLPIRRAIAP